MAKNDDPSSFGSLIVRAKSGRSQSMAESLTRALTSHHVFGEPLPSVGRYKIRRKIGEGGMAVVFEGWDPNLSRPVAIKVLHGDPDSSVVDIQHEARVLARLTDPAIVTVFDLGVENDQVWFCMAYVDGGDAARWLTRHGRIAWKRIVGWFADAARGLHTAHRANIIHRDFKLENLLIGSDGLAKVTDFGLARFDSRPFEVLDHNAVRAGARPTARDAGKPAFATWTGLAGTPGYIAPEVRAGGHADARSDQWAFFVTLDRALAHTDDEPPGELATMIERGTLDNPKARYPDLAAVEGLLRKLLELPDTGNRRTATFRPQVSASQPSPVPAVPYNTPRPRANTPTPTRVTPGHYFKGTSIATMRRWCGTRGPNVWETALASLDPDDRRIVENAISIAKQPIDLYPKLVRATLTAGDEPTWDAAYQLGRWSAEYELGTIHRLLMRLLNPETVVERALSLWPRYYDSGSWNVDKQPHQVVAELTDWAIVDELSCAMLAGFIVRLWELAGRSKARVHHDVCRRHGAPSCEFVIRWD